MSGDSFDLKKITCNSSQIHSKMAELETEWLTALLKRCGVPKMMIIKAQTSETFSMLDWAEYLISKFGIVINKNLTTGQVQVKKFNIDSKESIQVGEWKKPEIGRVKDIDGGTCCELYLKYWTLL